MLVNDFIKRVSVRLGDEARAAEYDKVLRRETYGSYLYDFTR